jgi:hypothetical protein
MKPYLAVVILIAGCGGPKQSGEGGTLFILGSTGQYEAVNVQLFPGKETVLYAYTDHMEFASWTWRVTAEGTGTGISEGLTYHLIPSVYVTRGCWDVSAIGTVSSTGAKVTTNTAHACVTP